MDRERGRQRQRDLWNETWKNLLHISCAGGARIFIDISMAINVLGIPIFLSLPPSIMKQQKNHKKIRFHFSLSRRTTMNTLTSVADKGHRDNRYQVILSSWRYSGSKLHMLRFDTVRTIGMENKRFSRKYFICSQNFFFFISSFRESFVKYSWAIRQADNAERMDREEQKKDEWRRWSSSFGECCYTHTQTQFNEQLQMYEIDWALVRPLSVSVTDAISNSKCIRYCIANVFSIFNSSALVFLHPCPSAIHTCNNSLEIRANYYYCYEGERVGEIKIIKHK